MDERRCLVLLWFLSSSARADEDDDDITMAMQTPERTQTAFVPAAKPAATDAASQPRSTRRAKSTSSSKNNTPAARSRPSLRSKTPAALPREASVTRATIAKQPRSALKSSGVRRTRLGSLPQRVTRNESSEEKQAEDSGNEPTMAIDDSDQPTMSIADVKSSLRSTEAKWNALKSRSSAGHGADDTARISCRTVSSKARSKSKATQPAFKQLESVPEAATPAPTEEIGAGGCDDGDDDDDMQQTAVIKEVTFKPTSACKPPAPPTAAKSDGDADETSAISFQKPAVKREKTQGRARATASSRTGASAGFDITQVKGNKYMKLECIGQGGSSKVYRVMGCKDKQMYALKRVKLSKSEEFASFENEIDLMRKLCSAETGFKHARHIVKLFDFEVNRAKKEVAVVMEKGELDLNNKLRQLRAESPHGQVDPNFVRLAWQQMLEAVHAIHEERVVHADLKPANFLFVNGALKLIDFGIAKSISDDTTNIYRESQVGTLNYMSPEALMRDDDSVKLGRPSDIWSLGCILYQMVYGKTPFADLNMYKKIACIPDPKYEIKYPPLHDCYDASVLDTIKHCLARDPKERARIEGAAGLLNDAFLHPRSSSSSSSSSGGGAGGRGCGVSEETLAEVVQELLALPATAVGLASKITKVLHNQMNNGKKISLLQFRGSARAPLGTAAGAARPPQRQRYAARTAVGGADLQTAKNKLSAVANRRVAPKRASADAGGLRGCLEKGLANLNLPEHENTCTLDQEFTFQ
eukprot:g5800.t1